MRWIELSLMVHPEAVEPVSEALATVAANGVAIEEPYTLEDEGQRWRTIPGAPVTIRAYLPEDTHTPGALRRLEEALWHLGSLGEQFIGTLQARTVDDEDWAEAWKAHFKPTRIGRHFIIKPTWHAFDPAPEDVLLALDPGMAFGTGTHPTTRLCLEAIEAIIQPGDTVLDVGTGSGILAIGALLCGASQALGVDMSAVAVRAARDNAMLNGLADRLMAYHGTLGVSDEGIPLMMPAPLDPGGDPLAALAEVRRVEPARVVVANILASVIGALAPALIAATTPGGTLIASGIIQERRAQAEEPLRAAGLRDITIRQEGDWLAIVGRRGS